MYWYRCDRLMNLPHGLFSVLSFLRVLSATSHIMPQPNSPNPTNQCTQETNVGKAFNQAEEH